MPPCLAAALCLASCNALEPSAPAEPEVEAAFDEQALYTSEIDVKFSEEMAASIESDFKAGKVYTKSMPFNELVDELGIVSVRRIFEDDERYLGRQHRAGLHLWYRLTLSGSSDRPMTRAADDIASIPGVVEAEPCRKVGAGQRPVTQPVAQRAAFHSKTCRLKTWNGPPYPAIHAILQTDAAHTQTQGCSWRLREH